INIGNVELEVIEPQDEESVYAQFLRDKGSGIHHVMFATPDYDKCSARMAANNVAVIGSGELQNTRFQMFNTEKDLGLICEIADGEALTPDESP
ncbi:MAG: VOC family protein, partial [Pseudomonadales bacterium]